MRILINDAIRSLMADRDIVDLEEHGILKLPVMSDEQYNKIKYLVEFTGGHWSEKNKGFKYSISKSDIDSRIADLLNLDYIELDSDKVFKIENNFYPTPDKLAKDMIEMADIKPGDFVLEPSAGKGNILKHILTKTHKYRAIECNKDNIKYLRDAGYLVNGMTFETYIELGALNDMFDAIVMNPPFCNELDLRHIMMAYDLLKPGGRLIALAAENSIYYDRPITDTFNKWLVDVYGSVEGIPSWTFKESGTNVDVVLITIEKCESKQY